MRSSYNDEQDDTSDNENARSAVVAKENNKLNKLTFSPFNGVKVIPHRYEQQPVF
jgi:hypothetical protein